MQFNNQQSPTPFFIIGHRGAAGEKFENSLSGFKHALTLNIDAIEFDIRKHGDELWVIHDDDLERLTDQSGRFESIANPADLHLKNGEPVPRLREVLDLAWGKMPLNIEIKSANTARLLVELLSGYPQLPPSFGVPWVLISSFDHRQLLELGNLGSPWPLAPITLGIPINVDQLIEQLKPWSWHMDNEYPDADFITYIQSKGIKVMIYTVNAEQAVDALRKAGANGIFTDYPTTFQHPEE